MTTQQFVDYFELLEVSPNASIETIEAVYRIKAKQCHPDTSDNVDVKKFSDLTEAYKNLTDPESREKFKKEYVRQQVQRESLDVDASQDLNNDAEDRRRLLSLFYSQRRQNMDQPGIGGSTLEETMGLPREVLEFHIWYFRQKGWIQREESGPMSITAEGVDKIESNLQLEEENRIKRITVENNRMLRSGSTSSA